MCTGSSLPAASQNSVHAALKTSSEALSITLMALVGETEVDGPVYAAAGSNACSDCTPVELDTRVSSSFTPSFTHACTHAHTHIYRHIYIDFLCGGKQLLLFHCDYVTRCAKNTKKKRAVFNSAPPSPHSLLPSSFVSVAALVVVAAQTVYLCTRVKKRETATLPLI